MPTSHLLIVDDAMIMRKRIRSIALEAGWQEITEAGDGAQALDLYEQVRPSLVTMDIVMPNLDGVAALKAIREKDPAARVVMISAVDQKEKLTECIQSGAIDFIVKPFDKERLKNLFVRYLPISQAGSRDSTRG